MLMLLTRSATAQEDCRTIAAPPPLATFGGPATAAPGHAEVGLGAGLGGTLFDCTHKLGTAWFGRFRRGITDRLDLGTDVLVVQHNDEGTIALKLALRYRILPSVRLEVGFGGADDSEGKALNADIGVTLGRVRPEKTWNHYLAFRAGGAHGFRGNVVFGGSASDNNVPPASTVILGTMGSTGRISDNARFVFEWGYGIVLAHGRSNTGKTPYFGLGTQFDIGH